LAFGPEYYNQMALDYRERRELLCAALREAGFKFSVPEGAYYVLADFSDLSKSNDREFALWLAKEAGVATVPGSSFHADARSRHQLHAIRLLQEEGDARTGGRTDRRHQEPRLNRQRLATTTYNGLRGYGSPPEGILRLGRRGGRGLERLVEAFVGESLRRHRFREVVALPQRAAQDSQALALFGAFDPLGDRLDLHGPAQGDDGAREHGIDFLDADRLHEGAVDLQQVDRNCCR
jgi:hypothetical protein